jgi:hypothetical protein
VACLYSLGEKKKQGRAVIINYCKLTRYQDIRNSCDTVRPPERLYVYYEFFLWYIAEERLSAACSC